MTVGIGYPDFQDLPQWRGIPLTAQNYSFTPPAVVTIDANVSNWASLQVRCTPAASQGVTLIITFYTDSTKVFNLGVQSWQIFNSDLQVLIPIIGPFMEAVLSSPNVGLQTGVLHITPTNVAVPVAKYYGAFNAVEAFNQTIAISATSLQQLGQVMAGPAYLTLIPGDTLGKLNAFVEDLDATGTGQTFILQSTGFTGPVFLNSIAQQRVLRLRIVNTDGAATHNLTYRLALLSQ